MPSHPNPGSIPKLIEAIASRMEGSLPLFFQGQATFVQLGNAVMVAVRSEQQRDWLEDRYGKVIRESVAEVFGPDFTVSWVVDPAAVEGQEPGASAKGQGPGEGTGGDQGSTSPGTQLDLFGDPVSKPKAPGKRKEPSGEDAAKAISRPKRRWKSLADFVVGPSNEMAHATALSVSKSPGGEANPLVIHGPVGTGKTHLLEGIYAGLKKLGDQRPVYVTAEEFTTRYVQAVYQKKMLGFRRHYRECTALLFDDLHFLATRKQTQEEFLYTFDELLADDRQVVVTMDCHPRHADELMPELVDRLRGGAVWSLESPDLETRLEILRKKATGSNPAIPDNVLKSLADSLQGNVRELEGAINNIRQFARVTGRPVDLALAREALGDFLRHSVRNITLADVDRAVCTTLQVPVGTLQSKARTWAVAYPRMVAIYLCRKHTAATLNEISKYFGVKTHSTSVAADKKVRAWLEKNEDVAIGDRNWPAKELIDRIERELQK